MLKHLQNKDKNRYLGLPLSCLVRFAVVWFTSNRINELETVIKGLLSYKSEVFPLPDNWESHLKLLLIKHLQQLCVVHTDKTDELQKLSQALQNTIA
jgi:hypothetical protein